MDPGLRRGDGRRSARRVTPGARIAAAIDILAAIDDGGRPADDSAADYFRRRRYIGAKDRVQVASLVYAVLRHRAVIDWWIARASKGEVRPSARSRAIAALALTPTLPYAASAGGSSRVTSPASGGGEGGSKRQGCQDPAARIALHLVL